MARKASVAPKKTPPPPAGVLLAQEALTWVGTPWMHAQRQRGIACDCIGLVIGCVRDLGWGEYALANYSRQVDPVFLRQEIEKFFDPVWPPDHLLDTGSGIPVIAPPDALLIAAGDLLLMRPRQDLPATHVGIALSSERMAHASEDAGEVTIARLSPARLRLVAGIYRWKTS